MKHYRALLAAFLDAQSEIHFEAPDDSPEAIKAAARAAMGRIIRGDESFPPLLNEGPPSQWEYYDLGIMAIDRTDADGTIVEEDALEVPLELRTGLDPKIAPNACYDLVKRLAAVATERPDGDSVEWGSVELMLLAQFVEEARQILGLPVPTAETAQAA